MVQRHIHVFRRSVGLNLDYVSLNWEQAGRVRNHVSRVPELGGGVWSPVIRADSEAERDRIYPFRPGVGKESEAVEASCRS